MRRTGVDRLRGASWVLSALLALSACSVRVNAPPEPPRSVRRGDEAFRYKDYESAIASYRTYVDQTDEGNYTARVLYKTALAQYRLSRYDDALKTLDELADRYPHGHWVQVDALPGDAEHALGRDLAALRAWDTAWRVGSRSDRQKLRT